MCVCVCVFKRKYSACRAGGFPVHHDPMHGIVANPENREWAQRPLSFFVVCDNPVHRVLVNLEPPISQVTTRSVQVVENFFFDRVLSDQAINMHLFLLANAMGSVLRLQIHLRVPVRVEQDHCVKLRIIPPRLCLGSNFARLLMHSAFDEFFVKTNRNYQRR